jgi:hypothetical protein
VAAKRTLTDYAQDRKARLRMEHCPVCRLPEDLRLQIDRSRAMKIPRETVLEWLEREYHITDITLQDITFHKTGRHDDRRRQD